jgi:phage terminase large subunit
MDISFLSPAQRTVAKEVIQQCAVSREYFVDVVLGVKYVEKWQREVLQALDSGETKISIRSGHGVGKTALCAWLALHFLLFRDDVKVIVTSPAFKQMEDGLIPEVHRWLTAVPEWMSRSIEHKSDRMVRHPNVKNNFMSFRTARKENPDALAGVHATNVLILVDEASGVDEIVYETGQGALSTEGAIAVLIGNPTKPSGFFFKTQTLLRDLWWTMKVSCLDSTRVSADYVESQARTYGLDSREYAVRVLGEFPKAGADAIIPRAYVQDCVGRSVEISKSGRVWGIDPGRGGDPTGFVERTKNAILHAEEIRYDDTMKLVGWVYTRWQETTTADRPELIYVDSNGLGAGVADRLLELGLPVICVNVSETASLNARYTRLRAECWYKTRDWFEPAQCYIDPKIPLADQLIEELSAVQRKPTTNGKNDVESKETMKGRGVKSPNLADALIITFARDGAIGGGSWVPGLGTNKYDVASYIDPSVY